MSMLLGGAWLFATVHGIRHGVAHWQLRHGAARGPNGHGWARARSWRVGVYRPGHDATATRSGGVLGDLAVILADGAERLRDLAGLRPAGAARPGRLDPTASLVERVATDPDGWVLVSQLCAQSPLCGPTHQCGKRSWTSKKAGQPGCCRPTRTRSSDLIPIGMHPRRCGPEGE